MDESESRLEGLSGFIRELQRGGTRRTCFRPWELELLLDLSECGLSPAAQQRLLSSYLNAVRRAGERGGPAPPRLAEFVRRKERAGKPAA